MDFKDICEQLQYEDLLEGLGVAFGLALLWQLFFQQGIHSLITLFITTIC